jgi:hypothetical protein
MGIAVVRESGGLGMQTLGTCVKARRTFPKDRTARAIIMCGGTLVVRDKSDKGDVKPR